MNGYIVKHKSLGIGKIESIDHNRLTIRFVDGTKQVFGPTVFSDGTISRANLSNGHNCDGPEGRCSISQVLKLGIRDQANLYEIAYDNDLRSTVSEVEIFPVSEPIWGDPLSRFRAKAYQNLNIFRLRENLVNTINKLLRNGNGLNALLSSRIDIHAHQAYVAGVVLTDSVRRYVLADEVGLGKTIEAGIIISDLLAQKPAAKILILCPSTLTQQWLCELYSKFGGHIFKLLDLHGRYAASSLQKVICSTTHAAYDVPQILRAIQWDMIVVDEVHELLASGELYAFVQTLSRNRSSLLLLSAVPAQRREDDLLRLLTLLEPDRYNTERLSAEFARLYAAQPEIGRRLRRLSSRIEGLREGEYSNQDVLDLAKKLNSLATVEGDPVLEERVKSLDVTSPTFIDECTDILHYVADHYRINRRVLRNRRQRLLDAGQLVRIAREFNRVSYEPDPLEVDAVNSAEELVATLLSRKAPTAILTPFTRLIQQSLTTPSAYRSFLEGLLETRPEVLSEKGNDFIGIGYMFGYEDWDDYADLVWKASRRFLSDAVIKNCLEVSRAWEGDLQSSRLSALLKLLKRLRSENSNCKVIVFAGYPSVARELESVLAATYGTEVTSFLFDLDTESKEKNVRKFQTKSDVWILVSDESGGEGRNFQFADELIHFDTPWYAARIEQRIGRLDRLGRDKFRQDVISNVIYRARSKEEAVVRCYGDGLEVYSHSISGLEFALRDLEHLIATTAIQNDYEAILEIIPQLADVAKSERETDESESVLDEASFEQKGAARFKEVSAAIHSGEAIEKDFTEYFRCISYPKAVKETRNDGFAQGVWRFYADDTRFGVLPNLNKDQEGLFGEFRGTFRRAIAQIRPDLEFFSVGNPFFDSVTNTLSSHTTGRTYAVAAIVPGEPEWSGFEFAFTAIPEFENIAGNPGMVNKAKNLFTRKPLRVFYGTDGTRLQGDRARGLLAIRKSLDNSNRNRTWWNLTNEKVGFMIEALNNRELGSVIDAIFSAAEVSARERLSADLSDRITGEAERIKEQIRRLGRRSDIQASQDITNLQMLLLSIANWKVQLDSLGFLSVNTIDLRS